MKIEINIGNEHILKHFPNFEYFNCTEPERLNFFKTNNLAGDIQRCFIIWHCIQEMKRSGGIGLDIGCGQAISPWCLGYDRYSSDLDYPHPEYGSGEYHPHLTGEGENLPFNNEIFCWIISHHSFEHMVHPLGTFKEWLRILKPGGALIMVMPDADYESKEYPWDKDHHIFFAPDSFKKNILDPCKDLIKTEVFNNLHNSFSFNYVGRKR